MTRRNSASSAVRARADTAQRCPFLRVSWARVGRPERIGFSCNGFWPFLMLLVPLFFVGSTGNALRADQVTDAYGSGTPVNSWEYLKLVNAGKGYDWTYVPVRSDYSNAVFQGYVVSPPNGTWGAFYFGADSIYIFRTNVLSSVHQTIPLLFGGDDGHAVYVNGVFQGGGPFNTATSFDLELTAGMPVQLELAGYNGPGGWVFGLYRQDNRLRLVDTPGVTINASPEPRGMFLVAIGLAGIAAALTANVECD